MQVNLNKKMILQLSLKTNTTTRSCKPNLRTIKEKNRGLDLLEDSTVAAPALEDGLESGNDDSMNIVKYEGVEEDGSAQDIARGVNVMLNDKVEARKKPLTFFSNSQQSATLMSRMNSKT